MRPRKRLPGVRSEVDTAGRPDVQRSSQPLARRGRHTLPHQSQVTGRDLDGEKIARHYGGVVYAYRRTAEQVSDCRAGKPGAGLPYEFLVYDPRSPALPWCAFYTRADLGDWLDAYALTLDREPAPGSQFRVRLPDDRSEWQRRLVTGP